MDAFDNEREEQLMHQHPPYEAFISPDHGNHASSLHDQNSGAGLTFFRRLNYGLSLPRQRTKYPEFRGA